MSALSNPEAEVQHDVGQFLCPQTMMQKPTLKNRGGEGWLITQAIKRALPRSFSAR